MLIEIHSSMHGPHACKEQVQNCARLSLPLPLRHAVSLEQFRTVMVITAASSIVPPVNPEWQPHGQKPRAAYEGTDQYQAVRSYERVSAVEGAAVAS